MNEETKNEKVFELLESTKLNWTVNKEPLVGIDGKATESFGMFRNDNDKWLGTVGNQYRAYQNHEMAELMVQASDGIGLDVTKGGSMNEGRKVFLQIPLEDKLIGPDTVKRNLTCLNSHDGSTSISFGSTNTVVSCSNQFHRISREKGMNRFRHSANSKDRINQAMQDMRIALGHDEELMKNFEIMANMPIKDEIFARVMTKAFGVNLDAKTGEFSTRKINTMKTVAATIEGELDAKGSTLWGLFNGVTYYTNHIAQNSDKDDYVMLGGGYKTNLSAFNEVMKWIDENSKTPREAVLI